MKKRKGMSFSEVLRHLLQESQREGKGLIGLAGSVNENDIDKKTLSHVRGERNGKNMFG